MGDAGSRRDTVEQGMNRVYLLLSGYQLGFIGVPGRAYRYIDYLWRTDKKHR